MKAFMKLCHCGSILSTVALVVKSLENHINRVRVLLSRQACWHKQVIKLQTKLKIYKRMMLYTHSVGIAFAMYIISDFWMSLIFRFSVLNLTKR